MNTSEDTTIRLHSENDNDELLLLTGLERLEYFSEKPDLKKKDLKHRVLHLIKKINL